VKNSPAKSRRVKKEELDEILEKETVSTGAEEKRLNILEILKNPMVWKCFIIILFSNMTTWGLMSWLPTYLLDVKGFSTAKMGIATAIPFIAAIFGAFTGGLLSDKLFSKKRKWIVMTGYVTGAVILFLTLRISSDNLYIFVVTIAFFAVSMATSAFWTIPLTQLKSSVIGNEAF
jgi:sugar phosphate permease